MGVRKKSYVKASLEEIEQIEDLVAAYEWSFARQTRGADEQEKQWNLGVTRAFRPRGVRHLAFFSASNPADFYDVKRSNYKTIDFSGSCLVGLDQEEACRLWDLDLSVASLALEVLARDRLVLFYDVETTMKDVIFKSPELLLLDWSLAGCPWKEENPRWRR